MTDLSAFRLSSTQKHVTEPGPSRDEVAAEIAQLGSRAINALSDVIIAADAVIAAEGDGGYDGLTREELIHDAKISQQQIVLMANAVAEGAEARSQLRRDIAELTAQRDTLIELVRAQDGLLAAYRTGTHRTPGRYIDAARAARTRLAELGVAP